MGILDEHVTSDVSSLDDEEDSEGASEEESEEEDESDEEEDDDEESDGEDDDEEEQDDDDTDLESDNGWTDEDGLSTDWEDADPLNLLQPTSAAAENEEDDEEDDSIEGSDGDDDDDEEDDADSEAATDSEEEEDSLAGQKPNEAFDDEPWGKAESVDPPHVNGTAGLGDEEDGLLSPINEKHMPSDGYFTRSRTTMIAICVGCILIALIGVIIGVVVGGKEEEPASPREPTPAPARPTIQPITASPTLTPSGEPTMMPATKFPKATDMPTMTAFPTITIPENMTLFPDADTYIQDGILSDFGGEDTLRVEPETVILISFNISQLPKPKAIADRNKTASLLLYHVISAEERRAAEYRVSRLPSTPISIESLDSETFSPNGGTAGGTFQVAPGDEYVEVEITDLLFRQAPFVRSSQETQLFLLIESLETSSDFVDSFWSRESGMPPELIVGLERETTMPTASPAPTITFRPSLRPSLSTVPSSSNVPTDIPSIVPSSFPTTSSVPTVMPTVSSVPTANVTDEMDMPTVSLNRTDTEKPPAITNHTKDPPPSNFIID